MKRRQSSCSRSGEHFFTASRLHIFLLSRSLALSLSLSVSLIPPSISLCTHYYASISSEAVYLKSSQVHFISTLHSPPPRSSVKQRSPPAARVATASVPVRSHLRWSDSDSLKWWVITIGIRALKGFNINRTYQEWPCIRWLEERDTEEGILVRLCCPELLWWLRERSSKLVRVRGVSVATHVEARIAEVNTPRRWIRIEGDGCTHHDARIKVACFNTRCAINVFWWERQRVRWTWRLFACSFVKCTIMNITDRRTRHWQP